MTMYMISESFDKKGRNIFKCIGVTDADSKKHTLWFFDHQKGREYVKNSFGVTHYMWEPLDPHKMPIADYPCSGVPGGVFSKRAVDVLRDRLSVHGDLHPLQMESGESYYLFDCWADIDCNGFVASSAIDGGVIKSIAFSSTTILPDLFMIKGSPYTVVDESFKELVESNGLTGMVFSPVEIIFSD